MWRKKSGIALCDWIRSGRDNNIIEPTEQKRLPQQICRITSRWVVQTNAIICAFKQKSFRIVWAFECENRSTYSEKRRFLIALGEMMTNAARAPHNWSKWLDAFSI